MRCPIETGEGVELLLAHHAGALDAERAATLENHLANCEGCREFAAAQRSVDEALELWEAPALSADFDQRLYRRIEQEVPWWEFLVRPFRPAFATRVLPMAAAAAMLLAVGLWMERPGVMPPPVPRTAELESLPAEQAEHALQEMEMMQEFSRLVRSDTAEPRM